MHQWPKPPPGDSPRQIDKGARIAQKFAKDLAGAVNQLLDNPDLRREMGIKARQRVLDEFSWTSIARQTLEFYGSWLGSKQWAVSG
jgi:glycosyltransferase involved in cell wall biosynthesis